MLTENEIGREIVDAALSLHKELGPGLLESVYEVVLAHELRSRGLQVERQVPVAMAYRGIRFDEGFRLDISVESRVTVEVKSVERCNNAHRKQLLTHLRLTGWKLGFLLNFGDSLMKNGIVRVVNGLADSA